MSLAGKHVVNTRAAHQAAPLDALLRAYGAVPLSYPCIAIVPPEDTAILDSILMKPDFDVLLLTSINTVTMLARRLRGLGASLAGMRTGAVGPATAQAAREQLGVEVSVIPDHFGADGLRDALEAVQTMRGMRILLPQSEIADRELVQVLMAGGADVTALAVYRTVRASGDVELAPLLRAGQVDAVTFTSSSTARFFLERLDIEGHAPLDGVVFASIGPQTTRTARERGLKTVIEAEKHTLEGLVEALAATFGDSP